MVMEIIREGLIITPTGSLEPSQGSYDVPVKLINDETYPYYTINMYVGYYVNGAMKKRKCETDSEGHYLIPGIAFLRSGIISISFLLETADKSQGLMTNALSYEIKHAPNVVVEVPADPTWQELVKEWIQELAGAVNVDNTLTKSGMAADAKATGDAISQLSDSKANKTYVDEQIAKAQLEGAGVDTSNFATKSDLQKLGNGLTATEKNLILTLFRNAKYTSDISTEYAQLEELFTSTVKTYAITNNLAHVINSNTAVSGKENSSYTATLSAKDGYDLSTGTVTIFMDGTDITSSVYDKDTFTITITSLTGDVEINAEAVDIKVSTPLYRLSEPMIGDGSTFIDTGVKLNLTDDDWCIAVDFEYHGTAQYSGSVFATHGVNTAQSISCGVSYNAGITLANGHVNPYVYNQVSDGVKFVVIHTAGEKTAKVYYMKDGVLTNETPNPTYWDNANSSPTNLFLGCDIKGTSYFDNGTINQFMIYGRVMKSDEINTFMGV